MTRPIEKEIQNALTELIKKRSRQVMDLCENKGYDTRAAIADTQREIMKWRIKSL